MRRKWLWTATAIPVLGFAAFWLLTIPATVTADALGPHRADLANGKTIFTAGGCSACHALPNQNEPDRLGGGLGLVSQFGTFYVPNISPDPKDGIGGWSEAQFVTAVTKGTSPEGEHLFPAFPYTSFQRMTVGDVRDLFAYIKTLPPVAGQVRENDVPFPLNVRRMIGGWKRLFVDGKPFTADLARPATWNRGAYLVNGPAHCAECHSPRNVLGAIDADRRFAGTPNAYGKLGFPNITQAKLQKWSQADIADLLLTGLTPDGDRVGGPMTEVVRGTSQLSEGDRAAMAEYLKSLPAIRGANTE